MIRGRTFRFVDSVEEESAVFFFASEGRVSFFVDGSSSSASTGLLLSTCNSSTKLINYPCTHSRYLPTVSILLLLCKVLLFGFLCSVPAHLKWPYSISVTPSKPTPSSPNRDNSTRARANEQQRFSQPHCLQPGCLGRRKQPLCSQKRIRIPQSHEKNGSS